MKGILLLPFMLFLILSCAKEKDPVIPAKPEPSVIPKSSEYPVENHFPAGPGNQPFADLPEKFDPTKSKKYQLKARCHFTSPYSGSPLDSIIYDYNDQGNLIKETRIFRGSSQSIYTYEYQNGLLYKKATYIIDMMGNRLNDYIIYTYEKGKLIIEDEFDGDGTKRSSRHYTYARNRLVFIFNDSKERNPFHSKYYYDAKGRLIKEESYYSLERIYYTLHFTYDDQDRVILKKDYEGRDFLSYTTEYKYQQNQIKPSEEVIYDKNNALNLKIYWIYTPEGHVLEEWREDATGLHPKYLNTFQNGVITQHRTFNSNFGWSEGVKTVYRYEKI